MHSVVLWSPVHYDVLGDGYLYVCSLCRATVSLSGDIDYGSAFAAVVLFLVLGVYVVLFVLCLRRLLFPMGPTGRLCGTCPMH